MPTPTATIFLPYSALDAVILRGARAAQPAASAVVPGTLYCVTDEGAPVERSNGTTWQVYSPTPGGSGTGTGDVVGPGVATDQAIALYDGTTGKLIQDSATTIPALTASIESSVTASVIPVDLATETTGTLPDARLSANVQLKPIAATDLPAHATRHQPGGADALAVDAAAATGSLRTLGTGAQQAAPGNDARFGAPTAPLAHHATHEPGGADALAALSAAILTSGTLPDARLSANVQMKPVALADLPASVATKPIAESDVTNLVSDLALKAPLASPALTGVPIAPTATAGTSTMQLATTAFVGAAVTSGTATPAAHHATHETGGSDAIVALSGAVITSGTVADARLSANVPLKNASNTFVNALQYLQDSPIIFVETAQPVDHRRIGVTISGQALHFQSMTDANGVVAAPLTLNRDGSATLPGVVAIGAVASGANPAGTGALRTGNGAGNGLYGRNAANTGDVLLIYVNPSNQVVLGESGVLVSNFAQTTPASWTPTFTPSAGSGLTSTNVGTYCRVGGLCFVDFQITVSALGSASSYVVLGGLPFASASPYSAYLPTAWAGLLGTGGAGVICGMNVEIGAGATQGYFRFTPQGGAVDSIDPALQVSQMTSTTILRGSGVYRVQ